MDNRILIESQGDNEIAVIRDNCHKSMKGPLTDVVAAALLKSLEARSHIEDEQGALLYLDGYCDGMTAAIYLMQSGGMEVTGIKVDSHD